MARGPKRGKNTVGLIRSLLPADRPFTLTDVPHWLHYASDGKSYREATIRTYLWRLSRQGVIRCLYETGQNECLWIAAESDVTTGGIETLSLSQVVELVLDELCRAMEGGETWRASEIAKNGTSRSAGNDLYLCSQRTS